MSSRQPCDLLPDGTSNPLGVRSRPHSSLDDGTAMFDSLTICEYLDTLAPGILGPTLLPPTSAQAPNGWTALHLARPTVSTSVDRMGSLRGCGLDDSTPAA